MSQLLAPNVNHPLIVLAKENITVTAYALTHQDGTVTIAESHSAPIKEKYFNKGNGTPTCFSLFNDTYANSNY